MLCFNRFHARLVSLRIPHVSWDTKSLGAAVEFDSSTVLVTRPQLHHNFCHFALHFKRKLLLLRALPVYLLSYVFPFTSTIKNSLLTPVCVAYLRGREVYENGVRWAELFDSTDSLDGVRDVRSLPGWTVADPDRRDEITVGI